MTFQVLTLSFRSQLYIFLLSNQNTIIIITVRICSITSFNENHETRLKINSTDSNKKFEKKKVFYL